MTDLILKLLGARLEAAGDLASVRLALQGGVGIGWVVLLALALGALGVWTYRQWPPSTTPARRWLLTGLRVAFLMLLTLLLLRPVLMFTVEGSVRRTLLLLVDGSASMQIKDPRVNADDLKRAALVKGLSDPTKGLTQQPQTGRLREIEAIARIDLLKSGLRNEKLDLLPRLDFDFDLIPFSFGTDVSALPRGKSEVADEGPQTTKARRKAKVSQFEWVEKLEASSATTPIGDALRKVVELKRGQPLAGVVLITDGGQNSGSSPREVAAQLKQEGVPLYVWGVGITSPRDIIVANLFAPEVS
ncbi:MAG: VWA domain-containing protein, partial [Limisphaerales bacterium]